MRPPTLVLVLAALLALLMPRHGVAQDATPAAAETDWLFTLTFRAADLAPHAETAGQATLTLTDVASDVLAFSDRPERQATLITTDDFAGLLTQATADPVNANLVARLPDSTEDAEVVVELRSAAYDRTTHTFRFEVTVIGGEIAAHPIDRTALPSATLQSGYLFVDPECAVHHDQQLHTCYG